MTFDDILAQIIDLLKRQGRVSYGALKRRFDLDDAYLDDLKGELLVHHPEVEADERGFSWTGETASGQEVASPILSQHLSLLLRNSPSPEVTPRVTSLSSQNLT